MDSRMEPILEDAGARSIAVYPGVAMGTGGRRLHALAPRIALLGLSIGLSLVVAEIFLRLFLPQTLGLAWNTADGLFVHVPGRSTVYQRAEFKSSVRINQLGFRGGEWPIPKPAGTYRVLALGDSMTEGLQVAENELFVSRIEAVFAGSTPRVEVLNAGVSGLGTADELAIFEAFGPKLRPDLVIVAFCLLNDTRGDVLDGRCRFDGETLACHPPQARQRLDLFVNHAKSFAGSYSHLYQLLRDASSGAGLERVGLRDIAPPLKTVEMPFGPDRHWVPTPKYLADGYALSTALLRALRDRVNAQGAELWIALVPIREQIEEQRWRQLEADAAGHTLERDSPQRALRRAAGSLGIEVIDPYEGFLARSSAGEKLFWQVDMHFTPNGHAEFARAIVDRIRATGLPVAASADARKP